MTAQEEIKKGAGNEANARRKQQGETARQASKLALSFQTDQVECV